MLNEVMLHACCLIPCIALSMALTGCTNSGRARESMRQQSEDNYGVMRTVTAYSSTGEQIGQWHGMIDVQYVHDSTSGAGERVDIVVFDGSEPIDRVVISGATVVVDND